MRNGRLFLQVATGGILQERRDQSVQQTIMSQFVKRLSFSAQFNRNTRNKIMIEIKDKKK